ncbi:MAG: DotU family type IV/VI secretion system protein [Planctomycetes bacterium]|nr:DotU family type IV/VI secretion system protein [Planctomycetota bacterium]
MTGAFRGLFLAIAAFHSETTRARLHPGQFHRTLEDLLAGADAQARASGLEPNLWQQAKYAAVALCDDLALHGDWDHAEQWNRHLLELRHFNTSFAGQEFFDRLARLRQQLGGVQDSALREQVLGVIEVYATCMRLGFRGRCRNAPPGELEQIVNATTQLLLPQGGSASRVWDEAYRDAPKGRILYRRLLWWWPIPLSAAAAVAVWFLLSAAQARRVDQAV